MNQKPAVLVVDDDVDTVRALEEILSDAGYRTAVALSGEEALMMLRLGARPRVVIVDLMMPNMDGWQLIRAIKDLGREDMAIISMTAGDQLMDAPVSAAYIQKPIDWDALLRTVARHCGVAPSEPPVPEGEPEDATEGDDQSRR